MSFKELVLCAFFFGSLLGLFMFGSASNNNIGMDDYIKGAVSPSVLWNEVAPQIHEIVQDEQTEPDTWSRSEPELLPEYVQDEQIEADPVPDEEQSDLQDIPDEWKSAYVENPLPSIEQEILNRLIQIDYSLRIISGAVILGVCSLFIWFTILKPIKKFIAF